MALSLIVVVAMIATAFFITPASARDQANTPITSISNPSGVTFYDIAWNEDNYQYAIAVGEDGSHYGVVYKFDTSTETWSILKTAPNKYEIYRAVVYDTYSHDGTFYFVGNKSSSAVAYRLNPDFSNTPLDTPSGASIFYGACFDPIHGSKGTLVAVGVDTGGNGVIATYDISTGNTGSNWNYKSTGASDVLEAVTWESYSGLIYAVGYNGNAGIAYSYDYTTASIISAPSNAGAFYGIDWQPNPPDEVGYALVVGEDTSGYGFVWMLYDGGNFADAAGISPETPSLRDVDWKDDGSMAVIVGLSGTVYAYYDSNSGVVVDWSDSHFTSDLYGVAVKSPGSPGYGLGVGASSSSKISYQVVDSSTELEVSTAYPHITRVEFRDQSNTNRVNQQVDVGNTYYFLIDSYYNLSGKDIWNTLDMNITAWYDGGTEITDYSSAPAGGNIRFKLHYNGTSGEWKKIDPSTSEITLPSAGTPRTYKDGSGNIHHVISINITFGPQIRWAPGDGHWDPATVHNTTDALNDANSWNFEVYVYDRVNKSAKDQWYDEFGIYSYTQVSASNNPKGAGPPGSIIYLKDNSNVVVSANRPYYVSVNVTDLTSSSGHTIERKYIYAKNIHPYATPDHSEISAWENFSINGYWLVWGNRSGTSTIDPLDNGNYSAGDQYGYNPGDAYTEVSWRVDVPAGKPEDHYTATITFEIGY